jgi:hypothetical protein
VFGNGPPDLAEKESNMFPHGGCDTPFPRPPPLRSTVVRPEATLSRDKLIALGSQVKLGNK